MRKTLLILLSSILFAFSVYIALCGISIGTLNIKSISEIKEENTRLDKKIQTASNLRANIYPQSLALVDDAYKKLVDEKENYEQLVNSGVDANGLPLNKIQEYEIERIWVTMGNYAQKHGVELKMDIKLNNKISKTYDLNFTAIGEYVNTIDFLYDVERDSTLVFKIENFKMVPDGSKGNVSATFTCRDIKLKVSDPVEEENSDETKDDTTNKDSSSNSDSANTSSNKK